MQITESNPSLEALGRIMLKRGAHNDRDEGVCLLEAVAWFAGEFDRLDDGFHSKAERRKIQRIGIVSRLSRRERAATPLAFRDVLLSIARSASSARRAA